MKRKLGREEAIDNHRKMWNWIADETERVQSISFSIKFRYLELHNQKKIRNDCFCCEYSKQTSGLCSCSNCPIDWMSDTDMYMCKNRESRHSYDGFYAEWLNCVTIHDWRGAAYYAHIIANLPERKQTVKEVK